MRFIRRLTFTHIPKAAWLAAVAFATLEAAARIEDRVRHGAPLFGNYRFQRLLQANDFGMRGLPGASFREWRINADGFRGPALRPNEGQARVRVYGASEAFGMYEPPGNEFPRVLERVLDGEGPADAEVINAALPGMRIGSGTGLIRDIGMKHAPDVAVIYPTPTHYIGHRTPYCDGTRPVARTAAALPSSRFAGKLRDVVKDALPPTAMTKLREASIAWQTRGRKTLAVADAASLSAFAADLDCAIAAARAAGMVPVLSTHANRFGSRDGTAPGDRHWLTGWRHLYPVLEEPGFLDLERRANAIVRETAIKRSVRLVDADGEMGGDESLFADHAHFSAQGAIRMGSLLAPVVRSALVEGELDTNAPRHGNSNNRRRRAAHGLRFVERNDENTPGRSAQVV